MTQPLKSCHPERQQVAVRKEVVQNKVENVLKCIRCDQVYDKEKLIDHLKFHVIEEEMRRKEFDSAKKSKTVVKLETMNLQIKRKRHGSSGGQSKRVKLQDGETELSVDPTVPKVLCKKCKPPKYFKDVEALRYHLVCSHNVSKSSSYYCDPSISPAKSGPPTPNKSEATARKVRVRSQAVISEIKDIMDLETEAAPPPGPDPVCVTLEAEIPVASENAQTPLGGKFKEVLRVRRMNLKRSTVNCRTPKTQPPCVSDKKDVNQDNVAAAAAVGSTGPHELDKDHKPAEPRASDIVASRRKSPARKSRRISTSHIDSPGDSNSDACVQSEYTKSTNPVTVKEEAEFAIPAPVKKSRVKPQTKPTEKRPEPGVRRRVSERCKSEGAKLFKCNHCDLSYSSLENKKVHEQTHVEKTLLCLYCDMRFYYPLCLKKHERIHKN